jgi:hypothetical protein
MKRPLKVELARENPASECLFVNPDTGQPYRDLKKGFAEACRLAGITNLRWHDLRACHGAPRFPNNCREP